MSAQTKTATFAVPEGWSQRAGGPFVELTAHEGDLRLVVVDVGAQMMKGRSGEVLWDDTIRLGIELRKKVRAIRREFEDKEQDPSRRWFFEAFVPDPTRFERGQEVSAQRVDLDRVLLNTAWHDPVGTAFSSGLPEAGSCVGVGPPLSPSAPSWSAKLLLMIRVETAIRLGPRR